MKEGPDIARIAALMGDPARANMLTALMTGKALTATELAAEAGITSQTASSHLAKLDAGGLLRLLKQGRHKYFSLANEDVAQVLEGLMGLAVKTGHLRTRTGPKDEALRKARVCYNHLAGDMGIALFDSFMGRGFLVIEVGVLQLTPRGDDFVQGFGVDVTRLRSQKSPLCKECLDWSARRSHLAGSLGRALLSEIEARGWAKRRADSRVVGFSSRGEQAFQSELIGNCLP
ncbi:hypothetical protein ROLI_028330 [Roseobacter fucihabitans]|uniref:HTH arsR-type domain-containing protein n=1 Tax=Roseobacter fucihabitans TaxID=1537242 RepID=A0ABZ2BVK3_9RHOB|nr:winged helix-turn-helix domain-containing protein [Roseobacter litoralis]MBC6964752.1 Helix-turn-helix domain protein [Roseobacter litoralis]